MSPVSLAPWLFAGLFSESFGSCDSSRLGASGSTTSLFGLCVVVSAPAGPSFAPPQSRPSSASSSAGSSGPAFSVPVAVAASAFPDVSCFAVSSLPSAD